MVADGAGRPRSQMLLEADLGAGDGLRVSFSPPISSSQMYLSGHHTLAHLAAPRLTWTGCISLSPLSTISLVV